MIKLKIHFVYYNFHIIISVELEKCIQCYITSTLIVRTSIFAGCELRYELLVVQRMSLGCFESSSKKFFFQPLVIVISVVLKCIQYYITYIIIFDISI